MDSIAKFGTQIRCINLWWYFQFMIGLSRAIIFIVEWINYSLLSYTVTILWDKHLYPLLEFLKNIWTIISMLYDTSLEQT